MPTPTTAPLPPNRRDFLKATSTAAAAAAVAPLWLSPDTARAARSALNEHVSGHIGTGSRWGAPGVQAADFSRVKALCDVDSGHLRAAADRIEKKQGYRPETMEEYRAILDDPEIDVVVIVTPDHWHTLPLIQAMQAGKDVYCEKPMTLTIQEGKQIAEVARRTGRTVQVGTQQRTEMGRRFLTAIAMIRDGRIGEVNRVTCDIGGSSDSGPIPIVEPSDKLNWERWLGQTPVVPLRWRLDTWTNDKGKQQQSAKTRCHYEFRWWYEYSGGKLTDWGAHHVDIAQWAIGQNGEGQGVTTIGGTAEHPVDLDGNGMPVQKDRYNAATKFDVTAMFPATDLSPEGVEMHIVSNSPDGNGILFEGTDGRFHVNRSRMKGAPVEDLKANPLPDGALEAVYKDQPLAKSHMHNFFDAVDGNAETISDVFSHHRALTTCHLANIAIRLGETLEWDAEAQQVTNNDRAREMQSREQREGYEIEV